MVSCERMGKIIMEIFGGDKFLFADKILSVRNGIRTIAANYIRHPDIF